MMVGGSFGHRGAFVIMQIGNPEMDAIFSDVICPAIEANGLIPRRVDKHNRGDLLMSEIVNFIGDSDIIVAELTNERQNCYLEVGYALGIGKQRNLVLVARDDHRRGSSKWTKNGPRIHFDLEGYDILFWDPDDLDKFREDLTERVARRLTLLPPPREITPVGSPPIDTEWRDNWRKRALAQLAELSLPGWWEAVAVVRPNHQNSLEELRDAVGQAQIDTFGWPIGISFDRDEQRPVPYGNGVRAEVVITPQNSGLGKNIYDLWDLQRNGSFYTIRGLFEDDRATDRPYFIDTRIVQATELLMFLYRIYTTLGYPSGTEIRIDLTHGDMAGRQLRTVNTRRVLYSPASAEVDEFTSSVVATVGGLESELNRLVRDLIAPFAVLFGFFRMPDSTYDSIIHDFVQQTARGEYVR